MRLLIIEPHSTGHHASYLRWLLSAAKRRAWDVVVATTTDALSHPALKSSLAELGPVEIHLMGDSLDFDDGYNSRPSLLRREFTYRRKFKTAVREVKDKGRVDGIVVPYIDYCFYALAILGAPFGGLPWCGISMRLAIPRMESPEYCVKNCKWRMAKRILRQSNVKALFAINPSVLDAPSTWCSTTIRSRLRYLADPAEFIGSSDRAIARSALGLTADSVAILIFGSIDERKGVDVLVGALASEEGLKDFVVVLAGRQCSSFRQQMGSSDFVHLQSQGRLIVLDRYLDEAEQGEAFAAADVVWVGYRDHIYMSGVLVLAGTAGLPVIGMNEGEIGRLISTHGLGAAAASDQSTDVARALRVMLESTGRREMGDNARRVFRDHTVERFGDTILTAFDP